MTTLATQSCGKPCNEDADFTVTFLINSLTLTNESKYSDDEKLLTVTWDGNVFRSTAKESMEEFKGRRQVLYIHCTPMQLNRKLKSSPILMNLTAFCEDLGTVKIPLTDCFCDAILCTDFNSQILKNDFKFVKDAIEHGAMDIDLKIERMDNQQSIFEAIKKTQLNASKRNRRKSKAQSDSDADDEDETLCQVDFACPNDIPEYCKKHLEIGEHSYRIINGHLMNVKDKKGFCGDICVTAMKYCKEVGKQAAPKKNSSIDLQKLFRKKTENVPKVPSRIFDDISNWKFSKKLESQKMKAAGGNFNASKTSSDCAAQKGFVEKKKAKKRTRKAKVCCNKCNSLLRSKSPSPQPSSNDSCNNARTEFIKQMKCKAVGKYSYEFGNSYPFHRSSCSVPNVCEKVPSRMGWRHDKVELDSNHHKSWRPGQINKIVRILMKHFLRPYPYDTICAPKFPEKRDNKDEKCIETLKPTLQVSKQDGEVSILMRPLKDNKQLATDCNPYLNCSPLKFLIKRHPDEIKMHQARKLMKSRGFQKKCNCNDIKLCRCISSIRKEMFKDEMKKVSRELNMKTKMQYEDVHDSSDSEIDFEFTPPTVLNSFNKCRPDVAHTGTQYEFKHFLVTKKEKSKYLETNQPSGCVDKLKMKK